MKQPINRALDGKKNHALHFLVCVSGEALQFTLHLAHAALGAYPSSWRTCAM